MPFYLSFSLPPFFSFSLSSLSHHCLSFYLSRCGYLFTTKISFSTFLSNHVSLSILFISLISASLHIFFSLSVAFSGPPLAGFIFLCFSLPLSLLISFLSLLPLSFSLKLICVCNFSSFSLSVTLSFSPSLPLFLPCLSLTHPSLSLSISLPPSLSLPSLSFSLSLSPQSLYPTPISRPIFLSPILLSLPLSFSHPYFSLSHPCRFPLLPPLMPPFFYLSLIPVSPSPSLWLSLYRSLSLPIFISHALYLSFSLSPAPVSLSIVLSPITASISFSHSYLSFYLPLSVTPSVSFSISISLSLSLSLSLSPLSHPSLLFFLPLMILFQSASLPPCISFYLFSRPFSPTLVCLFLSVVLFLSLLALSLSLSPAPIFLSISLEPGLFLSFSLSHASLLLFLPLMALFQSASLPPWTWEVGGGVING